jgi:hypothetical protein
VRALDIHCSGHKEYIQLNLIRYWDIDCHISIMLGHEGGKSASGAYTILGLRSRTRVLYL